ncbi:hypothetical protein H6G04_34285 [Calothrix membranacea FACHB-236]|nr:hypothetical protein [Calothrix membranacea FACHB-236]
MANLSTFGLVLEWVSEQLKKVEKGIDHKNKTNAAKHIPETHKLIDKLIQHEQELAENFQNNVVDDEYKALVDIIQKHNKTIITLELNKKTIQRLKEGGASPKEISDAEKRMQDMM